MDVKLNMANLAKILDLPINMAHLAIAMATFEIFWSGILMFGHGKDTLTVIGPALAHTRS